MINCNSIVDYIHLVTKKVLIEIMIGLDTKVKKGAYLVLKVVKVDKNNINREMVLS